MIIIRVSQGQSHGDSGGISTVDITWQHSTAEETPVNTEIRPIIIADVRNDDVEAQHPDFRKVSTETNHESTPYKP